MQAEGSPRPSGKGLETEFQAVEQGLETGVEGTLVDFGLAPGEQVGLAARIDFFDDQIESIKRFDLDSMGSLDVIPSLRIGDLKGQLPESSDSASLFSYLPAETIVVLWSPLEIAEQAKSYLDRLPDVKGIYPLAAVLRQASQFGRLELSQFDQGSSSGPSFLTDARDVPHVQLPIRSLQRF